MKADEMLAAARDGLTDMAERCAGLIEATPDTSVRIPGSAWTVRDAAAHLAGSSRRYAGLVAGGVDVSAVPLDKAYLDARARSLLDDNPETDPQRLADQIREGYGALLEATATVPAYQTVAWYAGLRPTAADMTAVLLGEPLLHGYDVATALGAPWPIDPAHAALAVGGYRLLYPAIFQPSTAARLNGTYRIEIARTETFSVRIAGGTYEELPGDPDIDCVISADPVAALLVTSGRLSRWPAIALGALRFTGQRPEIGPGFFDLFVFP